MDVLARDTGLPLSAYIADPLPLARLTSPADPYAIGIPGDVWASRFRDETMRPARVAQRCRERDNSSRSSLDQMIRSPCSRY